jgi:hypothetical protein
MPIRKIATVCGCAKSTAKKGRYSLPLKGSEERDETLAAGLKHKRNCGRLKS